VEFLNHHLIPQINARDAHEWWTTHETKHMVFNIEMLIMASLFRIGSMGSHFKENYPRRLGPEWAKLRENNRKEVQDAFCEGLGASPGYPFPT
jgi:succinate dehydrogenase/fumarate reductase flavoprotein subunit